MEIKIFLIGLFNLKNEVASKRNIYHFHNKVFYLDKRNEIRILIVSLLWDF